MIFENLPKELIHIILDYDGRIKYRRGMYVNRISKYEKRCQCVIPVIMKKLEIMKKTSINGSRFYFEIHLGIENRVGLCYDYYYLNRDKYELCYYDRRNGWEQIRTYIIHI